MERSDESKKRLRVRWTHPVPTSEESLDFETALAELRGNDPRPLLILRDCDFCKGKDHALLDRTLDNEKTLLFTQWYHCVKLDRRVVEKSHPWHAIFADEKPPHLLILSWDGSKRLELDGKQKQSRLWDVLSDILSDEYKKSPELAIKAWQRHLDSFDTIISRRKELERQLDERLADGKKTRADKIEKQLADLEKEYKKTLELEAKTLDLILKRAPKAKTVADFDAEVVEDVQSSGSSLLDKIRKDKDKSPVGAGN
ncbi:MAG: hypothetical protein H6832_04665 [Planctomycetes bacterium]|nr:hypothetical protein [Planctomycetota bacterium]MCB9917673.1 hypothetical protein [Planctomycetota bacterium]